MEAKNELQNKIDAETALIKELEGSYPPYNQDRYSPERRAFEIHDTKVRDAYWRRRMLITKRDGGDLNQTAKVY